MNAERIIEKTLINSSVIVITMETVRPGMIVGVHPCLQTNVVGVEGISRSEPYRLYINQAAALVGHAIVCDEIKRTLIELRALGNGISPALLEGVL